MPIQLFHATVDRVYDLTHDVRQLDFQLRHPKEIQFKSGQFISFDLTAIGGDRVIIRPYSIASPPYQPNRIAIVFNRVPGGRGSTYLFSLKAGDTVAFEGPQGSFHLRERTRDILFVATGTGIAPIRSMLLDLLSSEYTGTIRLYWGLRAPRDLYYQQEFEALAARFPSVSFAVALSRADAGWHGYTGRVTGLVEERITSVRNLDVYLCGNHVMIRDVTDDPAGKGTGCPLLRAWREHLLSVRALRAYGAA